MKRTATSALLFGCILAVTLLVPGNTSNAQMRHFEGGVNFQLGFPQGEFGDNVDNLGFGFGIDALWMPMEVGVGVSVNYLIYGSESRREPFSMTIPDVTVEVNTTNSILLGHLLMRLQYPRGVVRPYVDGLVGLNYLATTTEIKSLNATNDDNNVASSDNAEDVAFSYGAGLGLMFKVYGGNSPDDPEAILIDLGVRYIYGGNAEYLKEGDIVRSPGRVLYNYRESDTDIMTAHIGVAVKF